MLLYFIPTLIAFLTFEYIFRGPIYFLKNYRWIFVCLFLIPGAIIFDLFYFTYNSLSFDFKKVTHKENVENAVKQIKNWNADGRKNFMCTSKPSWKTVSVKDSKYKSKYYNINVDMAGIIRLNLNKMTIEVEPQVTMKQISDYLTPLGLTLTVLPELDELTVGGLILGTGIESSSHIYGLFQHCAVSYDIVTSNGDLVTCSKDDKPDLFYSIPWSYGTLGFLVRAEVKIIPSKKYVKLTYEPLFSTEDIISRFTAASKCPNPPHFVECLLYSRTTGVLMTGDMSDGDKFEINNVNEWHKKWFYTHVQDKLSSPTITTEMIPLNQYYHRHSRGLFWQTKEIIPFGNHALFRYLFGWMYPLKISLLKLTQNKWMKELSEKHQLIQDMLVPIDNLSEVIDFLDDNMRVYPLWLCPMLVKDDPGFIKPTESCSMFVDVGSYGPVMTPGFDNNTSVRSLEKFVRSLNGFQMLYSDCYASREEFKEMFDHRLYESVRKAYACEDAFPEVYDKIKRSARE